MSVATTTTNYGLPIFAGTDHGNWFDFNTGFQAIDMAIKAAATAAKSAQTTAGSAVELANSASSLANSVNTNLTKLSSDIEKWISSVPTSANANIFNNPVNANVTINRKLGIICIQGAINCVANQTWSANAKVINLGQNLNITANHPIASAFTFLYTDTENKITTRNYSGTIFTDNTLGIDQASPSDYKAELPGSLNVQIFLSTYGWSE